jgi:hypothetical protein
MIMMITLQETAGIFNVFQEKGHDQDDHLAENTRDFGDGER